MRGIFLALGILVAPLPAYASQVTGFSFPVWSRDAYASPRAVQSLDQMREMGAGWIVVIPTLYVKDAGDVEVLATAATATDESLRFVIRSAHARGLKVLLKPHVDLPDASPRAGLSPKDHARWFETYGAHFHRYARLAADEKVEMLAVGTELALLTLPKHTPYWKTLIRETRLIYPGTLTYAANWHSVAHVGFWKDLDVIGVDGYYPVPGGSNRAALEAGWRPWVLGLAALSKINGKPVLFAEVGLAAQKGANLKPWAWNEYAELDLEVQTAYMDAFVRVFEREPWYRGFLYWAWESDVKRTGPLDRSMSLQGKPAEQVLRRAFSRAKAVPPPEGNWREKLRALSLRLAGVEF